MSRLQELMKLVERAEAQGCTEIAAQARALIEMGYTPVPSHQPEKVGWFKAILKWLAEP